MNLRESLRRLGPPAPPWWALFVPWVCLPYLMLTWIMWFLLAVPAMGVAIFRLLWAGWKEER